MNTKQLEQLNKEVEKAENEIYSEKVSEGAKMNLSFAEGFIQGQVSMRKFYKEYLIKLLKNNEKND